MVDACMSFMMNNWWDLVPHEQNITLLLNSPKCFATIWEPCYWVNKTWRQFWGQHNNYISAVHENREWMDLIAALPTVNSAPLEAHSDAVVFILFKYYLLFYDVFCCCSLLTGQALSYSVADLQMGEPRSQHCDQPHHIEHGHHQDESGGCHCEDQSQPGVVGDNAARGSGEPWEGAERALPSLLWKQRNRKSDQRMKEGKGQTHPTATKETSYFLPLLQILNRSS